MARAALDDGDIRLRDQAQQLRALLAHVLRARMAGHVEGDAALDRRHAVGQPLLARDVDDIFARDRRSPRRGASRSRHSAGSAAIRISASARRTAPARRCRSPRRYRARRRRRPFARRPPPRRSAPAPASACRSNADARPSVSTPFFASTAQRGLADGGVVVVAEAGGVEHRLAGLRRRGARRVAGGLAAACASQRLLAYSGSSASVSMPANFSSSAAQRHCRGASPNWPAPRDQRRPVAVAVGLGQRVIDRAARRSSSPRPRDSAASDAGNRDRIRAAARRGISSGSTCRRACRRPRPA